MAAVTEWLTWRTATERALYGPDGFYRRPGAGPAAHFRTSAHNPVFAEAVGRLLLQVDERLGAPERLDFVDLAAGRGELAAGVVEWLTTTAPALAHRLRATAVDFGPRPEGLPAAVGWAGQAPEGTVGLLFANEWLDNVPCDVAEVDPDGALRIVEVYPADGSERLGTEPDRTQREWLARWWPLDQDADTGAAAGSDTADGVGATGGGKAAGARAEIGLDRDAAWRSAVGRLDRGMAVAVDYAHTAADRPRFGTLTGYREGHQVPAVPDGSCDITAHVALDACAAALGGPDIKTLLTTQREFLRSLGISGARPDLALASADPMAYLRGLSRASGAAELTDPGGLGGFGWLIAFVGC
ncbi:MAG: SAM-dependent methyltransferase [Catenulispora sp.]